MMNFTLPCNVNLKLTYNLKYHMKSSNQDLIGNSDGSKAYLSTSDKHNRLIFLTKQLGLEMIESKIKLI